MFTNARVLEETSFQFRDLTYNQTIPLEGKCWPSNAAARSRLYPQDRGLPEILGGQDAAEEALATRPLRAE